MNKLIKKLGVLSIVSALAISTAIPAFAANTKDVHINSFTVRAYTQYIAPQRKDNASSIYLKLHNINTFNRVMVNVFGQTSGALHGAQKIMANDGIDNRIVNVEQKYFIRNQVHEKGFGHATLGFSRAITIDYDIAGLWSSDSVYEPGVITI